MFPPREHRLLLHFLPVAYVAVALWLVVGSIRSASATEDTSSSEYWTNIFGDPNRYIDIRLAGRDSPNAAYTFASVSDTVACHNLTKQNDLWVVVGLMPVGGDSFPQAVVARVERSLPDFQGRSETILLTRGNWANRAPYPGYVSTVKYEAYHHNHELGDYTLRKKFHQELSRNVKTDDFPFLWLYLFGPLRFADSDSFRRCYLMRVDGLRKDGSWIPFNIGTDGPFAKVAIDVFRLKPDRSSAKLHPTIEIEYPKAE